jgi:EAL domain-containing protein (putative c-di-GMP-specific phosphodiesterase class I)
LWERRELELDLRQALQNDELEVHFQPQFSSRSLEITGFEALARWRHPTRGAVPPAVFIPIAEECGLITDLGRWVMERACTEAVSWLPQRRVAINVSPAQFKDGRLQLELAEILARTGLSPHLVEIEVTEGVLLHDDQRVLETLGELKSQGIRVALDDFGMGYSSLSYLGRFPFDRIKIDKSFVQQQTTDSGARVIVDAILLMSRHQLEMLRAQGCAEIQGFLVGVPIPANDVAELLRKRDETDWVCDDRTMDSQAASQSGFAAIGTARDLSKALSAFRVHGGPLRRAEDAPEKRLQPIGHA